MARELVEYDPSTKGSIKRFFTGAGEDLKNWAAEAAPEVVEKAEILIGKAQAKLENPVETIERVAAKAIPASLAACASLQYTGGQGSFANFLQPIMLSAKFFIMDPQRTAYVGKPYHQVSQLSILSGYVKCRHVVFDVGASSGAGPTLEEQQIIKAYLESGCFIE